MPLPSIFDERTKKAVEAVSDLGKQLITLATGVVAITISFAKDIFGGHTRGNSLLMASWVIYLLSIIAGIVVLMGIAGTLDPLKPLPKSETTEGKIVTTEGKLFEANVRIPAAAQILTFIVATVLVAVAGIVEVQSTGAKCECAAPGQPVK